MISNNLWYPSIPLVLTIQRSNTMGWKCSSVGKSTFLEYTRSWFNMQHCFKNPVVVHVCNPTPVRKKGLQGYLGLHYKFKALSQNRGKGLGECLNGKERAAWKSEFRPHHSFKNPVLAMCSYNSNALEWKAKARRPSLGLSNCPFSSRGSVTDCLKGIR